jgi:hypothetical protein
MVLEQACLVNNSDLFLSHFDHVHAIVDLRYLFFYVFIYNIFSLKASESNQRSTKHTHKTKDRVTRTPLKTGMNSGAPEG